MTHKLSRLHRPIARAGRADWYKIHNFTTTETGTVVSETYIYDEIGYFGTTASDFVRELKSIKADQIDLHISSPGGEVYDGLAIYETIKQHPAKVTVKIDSLAASAASVIAMAGDVVEIGRNAEMMVHDGMVLVLGNADDLRKAGNRRR